MSRPDAIGRRKNGKVNSSGLSGVWLVVNWFAWIVLTATVIALFVVGDFLFCRGSICRHLMSGNSSDDLRK